MATQPTDAQFVIFPKTELLPREEQQVDAFKKRYIPTVRLQWLVRMKRLRCITSWTQWAMDPTYQIEPLIEDHELDFVLRMLGVDDIEDESVNLGEICKVLSRRVSSHLLISWVVTEKSICNAFTDSCAFDSFLTTPSGGSKHNSGGTDPTFFRQSTKKSMSHLQRQYQGQRP